MCFPHEYVLMHSYAREQRRVGFVFGFGFNFFVLQRLYKSILLGCHLIHISMPRIPIISDSVCEVYVVGYFISALVKSCGHGNLNILFH